MKLISFIIFLLLYSQGSFGRCASTAADHILNQALMCNEARNQSLRNIPNSEIAQQKIVQLCMEGCSGFNFDESLNAECDKKFAEVLIDERVLLSTYARSNNCEFDSDKLRAITSDDPLYKCVWVTNTVLKPLNSFCSSSAACVGKAYCYDGPHAGNQYHVQCAATSDNKCPQFIDCAKAESPSWVDTLAFGSDFDIEIRHTPSNTTLTQ